MTVQFRRHLAAALVIVAAGVVRLPMERAMTADFREAGLLQQPLDISTRKKIGQGFWAVTLGGLRSTVATILSLRAQTYFEENIWDGVADTYDTIVQLAPNTDFYWDIGHWHLAYNAASYYQNNYEHLPELRARALWRRSIEKGTAFLEEGVKENPDSASLWSQLGWLYSNPLKLPDYTKAAEAYRHAAEAKGALPYMKRFEAYSMARSPKYVDEALPLVRELSQTPGGKVPNMQCLLFVLEMRADPSRDGFALAMEIFGNNREDAYRKLGDFFLNIGSEYPLNGLEPVLHRLEKELDVPDEESVFAARLHLLKESEGMTPFDR